MKDPVGQVARGTWGKAKGRRLKAQTGKAEEIHRDERDEEGWGKMRGAKALAVYALGREKS
jgi:hypothetical protein